MSNHFVEACRLGIYGHPTPFIDCIDPCLQRRGITDLFVIRAFKAWGLGHVCRFCGLGLCDFWCLDAKPVRDPLGQGAKFHFCQKRHQLFRDRGANFEVIEGKIQWRVFIQLYQAAAQTNLVSMVDQGFAALGLLDLCGAFEKGIKITIFVDQQGGGFDPDARCAGHIVDAVARQSLHIDHAFGVDAKFFVYTIAVNAPVLHSIQHLDSAADQLHQILV